MRIVSEWTCYTLFTDVVSGMWFESVAAIPCGFAVGRCEDTHQ